MAETFTPKTWADGQAGGTPITASELNRVETGIESLDDRAAALELGVHSPVTVSYAASVTINATLGSLFRITATGDLTITDITGGVEGQSIDLLVKASGATRTLTVAGSTTSIPAGVRWWGRLIYDSSDTTWSLDDGSGSGGSGGSGGSSAPLTAVQQLSFTDSANVTRAQIVSPAGDLWILANAYWDPTADEFYRIDKTKAAFGWQIQGQGLIPGEPELGYNVAGATTWVAQPEAYNVIRNGGSTSNPRFGGVGGWELGHTLTQERQFTVGGMGIELDGSGTYPYSRVVHSTTGTSYARRLSGGMHNTYPDLGGRDDTSKPGWFWGWNEQYNTGDMTTVAGSRKWVIAYLPAGGTSFLTRFSVDEFGTVAADNLHADSALCVGYPDLGGGATVLGVQNATTVPTTNPTNGAIVYAQSGELRCRASSGAVTTLSGDLVHAVGNSGTTLTLDASSTSGWIKTVTLTANCTITLTGAVAGRLTQMELVLTQDGTGNRTVTFSPVPKTSGGLPTLSGAAGAVDRLLLSCYNGSTWYLDVIGKAYA